MICDLLIHKKITDNWQVGLIYLKLDVEQNGHYVICQIYKKIFGGQWPFNSISNFWVINHMCNLIFKAI
jgi:hypothetical protein